METKLPLKIKHRHRGLNKTIIIKCLPCLEISGKAFCEILEKGWGGVGGETRVKRGGKKNSTALAFISVLPSPKG